LFLRHKNLRQGAFFVPKRKRERKAMKANQNGFDGHLLPVGCPCEGCDEAIFICYIPHINRMRCVRTNEPFDIQIMKNGSVQIHKYNTKKTIIVLARIKPYRKPIKKITN
jgi:hypothetical protein